MASEGKLLHRVTFYAAWNAVAAARSRLDNISDECLDRRTIVYIIQTRRRTLFVVVVVVVIRRIVVIYIFDIFIVITLVAGSMFTVQVFSCVVIRGAVW